MQDNIYNPLDKENLGISVADAMLKGEKYLLKSIQPFKGAGIYALYYSGKYEPYSIISDSNLTIPVYVGKAIPPGARKGSYGLKPYTGATLFKRINEHASSIECSINLNIEDFYCQYLIVDDIWIPLGEQLLIAHFHPLWNTIVDGFGNHDPGRGRYKQERSRWDVLHPGRSWAEKCAERSETQEQIEIEVITFLKTTYNN